MHSRPVTRHVRPVAAAALVALIGGTLIAPAAASAAPSPDVPTAPVLTSDSTWHYLDDNADPARGDANLRVWTTPSYDDSAWKSAQGAFGAKNGALGKVGPHQPRSLLNHYIGDTKTTVPTYFFRTDFTLEAGVADQVASLAGTVTYDDALVVWVNGTKVASYVDGRITETTNLEYAGDSNGDPLTSTFAAKGDLLKDGENTIAVALYQDRSTSSDIYFDLSELKLVSANAEPVAAPPTRVILTPTTTPETSQSFSWLAGDASHTTGQVQIAPVSGGTVRTVDAGSVGVVNGNPLQHFSATVDGLTPASDYRYRVGFEGSWSDWHEFRTADPKATDFQFVYYGDAQIGLDTTWPSVVKQAEANAPRSIGSVHAGDLINTGSNETEWLNWFKGMQNSAATTNVMAAPGNHEYSGDKMLTAWKANFEYPHNNPSTGTVGELANLAQGDTDVARQYKAYFEHWSEFAKETAYYTDYQNVRFITLNATRDTTFLTPTGLPECTIDACPKNDVSRLWTRFQAAWLDHILSDSPSKWNVVTFHQPVYSTSAGRDEPILRDEWVPVFERNDIDLVMMGHDHTYARGYKNTTATETPGLTTGPVYMVSNSGAKHYNLETPERNVWTNNGATQVMRGERVTTYQVIDVSKDQLVYRSYIAEKVAGASTDKNVGDVYDEFTVTKYDDGEKWVTEAGMTPPAQQVPASLTLQAPTVTAGDAVSLSGAGFAAGEKVLFELRSEPVSVGEATADADGALQASITIPASTPAGVHTLVAIRENGDEVAAPVTVAAAEVPGGGGTGETPGGGDSDGDAGDAGAEDSDALEGSLATTGADSMPYLAAAGVLLLVGLALVAVRRRRAREEVDAS
ncbi:FN3 domain-containing metallophosphoesterase family protein [Microbacterium sp. H1-D42]|uniref:FN3 domain-containing metallophosphoesterase family protein n=1 Tax=Microbacterium sp. H1-D42 TaxID=2925844 RepID=UPI001F531DE2|nr:FN3 domain-containing metallophosphoesterase family protein [Microbacterium sp. H1-D42]UNK70908.1 metallophosphoesterase [Microbacterium sp. H1-D42]